MVLRLGYQETEIGVLPVAWEVRALSALPCAVTDCHHSTPVWKPSGVVVIRNQNIREGKLSLAEPSYTDEVHYRERVRRAVPTHGDLVLTREAPMGQVCMVPQGLKCCLGQRMVLLRVTDESASSAYLLYALQARPVQQFIAMAGGTGSTVSNLRIPIIESLPIATPELSEQRAIAAALSDVDALLEGLTRLIAKKRDLRQAAMQQLLTGQTRLPGFSGPWKSRRLGDHVAFLRNGVNSRAELRPEGAVKYLHYGDVHSCSNSFIEPQSLPSLPADKATRLDRLRDGDVIFADASEDIAGVCKSVELRGTRDTEVVSGLHTIAARFDKAVLADGFKGLLQFCPPFATHLRRLAAGTKVYATNRAHIATVEMRLPDPTEQAAIAAVLADMDAELAALEARRDKTRLLKQGMMQELLTGRTRLV